MAADARALELSDNLQAVRERISSACTAVGRTNEEITLIVVTKFFPVGDVLRLHAMGVRDIGESRDQEAAAKIAELDPVVRADLQVHFIGQLQSNKASHVGGYADCVHSVDRAKIARALDRGGVGASRTIDALVQVDLSGDDDARGGVAAADPEELLQLADLIASAQALRLRGVMAVAPRVGDPAAAFARLRDLAAEVRARHPDASWISAGMSGDLEQAVANGATHLRVGSAILGSRPPQR